jgi:hypothetical protein
VPRLSPDLWPGVLPTRTLVSGLDLPFPATMPCAGERWPEAGSPDAGGDAAAGGGRGRVRGAPGGAPRRMSRRRWAWAGARSLAGQVTRGWAGRVAGPPGAGAAAEAVRCADAPAHTLIATADPRQLEFAFALWTRDMVRTLIRREFAVALSAVSIGRAATHPGPVAAAAAVAGLAGRPRRRRALEERAVPGDPRPGQGRGRHDLLR